MVLMKQLLPAFLARKKFGYIKSCVRMKEKDTLNGSTNFGTSFTIGSTSKRRTVVASKDKNCHNGERKAQIVESKGQNVETLNRSFR